MRSVGTLLPRPAQNQQRRKKVTIEAVSERARPSVAGTLLVLAGTVLFMTIFLGLYGVLGVGTPYMGLLFLLYWAAMLHMDFSNYLGSIVGAVTGTVLGWMLIALPVLAGLIGTIAAYSALGLILFCYTRAQGKLFANNGTLLFVLVATIPDLQVTRNIVQMVLAVLLGAAFMGAVAYIMQRIRDRRQDPQTTQAS